MNISISLKFNGPDVLVLNNVHKFIATSSTILTRNKTYSYKCNFPKCNANVILSDNKKDILSLNLRHNHATAVANTTPSRTKSLSSPKNSALNSSDSRKSLSGKNTPSTSEQANPSKSKSKSKPTSHNATNTKKTLSCAINQNSLPALPYNSQKENNITQRSGINSNVNYLVSSTPKPVVQTNEVSNGRPKFLIVSDSMGRGMSAELASILPGVQVSSFVYPNARFDDVVQCAVGVSSNLTKKDFLLILAGTNNIAELQPNTCARLSTRDLLILKERTNLIVCSIPYRHDEFSYKNTNICNTNQYLYNKCLQHHINYISCHSILRRSHYTSHGLHFNAKGKRFLSDKIKCYVLPYLPKHQVSHDGNKSTINLLSVTYQPYLELHDVTCPFEESDRASIIEADTMFSTFSGSKDRTTTLPPTGEPCNRQFFLASPTNMQYNI